jgi:hypothetical protein
MMTGREEEWATWDVNSEESGGEASLEMGEQVTGQSLYRSVSEGGNKEGLPNGH